MLTTTVLTRGQHCRLSNISEEGTWRQSECFVVSGRLVKREAGEAMHPKLMSVWRNLRQQLHPRYFLTLEVWQQPCARIDGVVYKWIQQLEAAEFDQLVRIVDMWPGSWTETAKECNFLLQQLQGGVGIGCTEITQITNTAFANPAKATAERMLREIQMLKGGTGEVLIRCKADEKEIMQVAKAVHEEM